MNDSYKQDFIKAGALAKEVRAFGKSLIVKNASYNDIIAQIREKISELQANAAFPPQMALNHVAAHFLPDPEEDIILTNQVVKLDVGICYNGAIGDCAVTVDLSGKHQKLIDAVELALLNAEKSVKVGVPLSTIGKVIDETMTSCGFSSVKNLAGHGLGLYQIHKPPTVPNYNDKSKVLIKPGMTFAIEPFGTNGRGYIREVGIPTIFSLIKSRSVKSPIAKALLEKMKTFNGLPFALHDFAHLFPLIEVKQGFVELLQMGIIAGYAPLIENAHTVVAQAENSVLVDKEGSVFITTR